MKTYANRPPRNTGPIEVRDFGPNGRRLGTFADCYDGSPWELHRGELIEQMGSKDLHGIAMAIAAALFRAHAKPGHTVMTDVYCDLSDAGGPSLRAPDVVLVEALRPKNEVYGGIPVVAVEVRGTQSKRYLEEKVQLFLEHDWPLIWILHVEQGMVEVIERGLAPVAYSPGSTVPLPPALGTHGLSKVPVEAFFESEVAVRFVADVLVDEGKRLGLDEGKRLGLDEGRRLATIEGILDLCELLGISVDDGRRRALALLDLHALEAVRSRIKRERQW